MGSLLRRFGLADGNHSKSRVAGATLVREERPGSGAGAVLLKPYRVEELLPAADDPPPEPATVEPRSPNPVAEEWRRTRPETFVMVARRFCERAPRSAEALRTACLAGDTASLDRLAETLKPTLNLFDLAAAEAASAVQRVLAEGRLPDLALAVLALEHEVWRVASAWQRELPPAAAERSEA